MIRLLQFLFSRRVLIIFLLLEVACLMLIKNNSPYYSAAFFTSSNQISGNVLSAKTSTESYFELDNINKKLQEENAKLKTQQYNRYSSFKYQKRSFKNNYFVKDCKVISNTIHFKQNYLTLDVGKKDGVKVGMGVVSDLGIVGIVKSTSDNFSTVTSVLHKKFMCSVKVGKSRELARMMWDGENHTTCKIESLPKHYKVSKGDSVYTSGYAGVFPEEVLVGVISNVETQKDKSFHDVALKLINDFNALNTAYVVVDKMAEEKESMIMEEVNE